MNNTVTLAEQAEQDAAVLLNHALYLSKASTSNDEYKIFNALDSNLKMWVQIESSLKGAQNLLPQNIKENLFKLSKFVERLTLSKGLKMTKKDFDCLININMQISEGLMDAVKNDLAKEEAFSLLKCAIALSNARESKQEGALAAALNENMKLWVYIKTLASSNTNKLPLETKGNLIKLADYVSGRTVEIAKDATKAKDNVLDTMIMTNLQISEGLMTNRAA